MTKFQLNRADAPWEYPSLGFTATTATAILDGSLSTPAITVPPDAYWSVYVGGSAETGITRFANPVGPDPATETPDGYILAYSDTANGFAATSPTAFIAVPEVASALAASYAALDGNGRIATAALPSVLRATTYFGLGAGIGSPRMPFMMNTIIDADTLPGSLSTSAANDYVGAQTSVTFEGNFGALNYALAGTITSGSADITLTSGTFGSPVAVGYWVSIPGAGAAGATLQTKILSIAGSTATLATAASTTVTAAAFTASLVADPTYAFGANDFFRSGTTSGDLAGIDHFYGRLSETHLYTPSTTLSSIRGLQAEAAVEAEAVGSRVTAAYSFRARSIRQQAAYTTRTVTDLSTTAGSTTITSATASFAAGDIGKTVRNVSIIYGTKIASVTNSTTAVLTKKARRTATGGTAEIFTPVIDTGVDMYAEGTVPVGVGEHYAIYAAGGRSKLLGQTHLAATAATDVVLTLQAPLSPGTGSNALEVYDVTLENRLMYISPTGQVSSSTFLVAFEGNGGQTSIGLMTGSLPGIRMGSGTDAELRRFASGVIESSAKFRWTSGNETVSALAGATKKFGVVGSDGVTYYITGQAI